MGCVVKNLHSVDDDMNHLILSECIFIPLNYNPTLYTHPRQLRSTINLQKAPASIHSHLSANMRYYHRRRLSIESCHRLWKLKQTGESPDPSPNSRLRVPSHLSTAIADIEKRKQKAAEYVFIRESVKVIRSNRRALVNMHGLLLSDAPAEPKECCEENIEKFGTVMDFARETEDWWNKRLALIGQTWKRVSWEYVEFRDWLARRRDRLIWEYERAFKAGPWS